MNFISDRPNFILVAACFEVSKVIAKDGKPVSDLVNIKQSCLECAPFLFDKSKIICRIKDLSVSRKQ